MSSRDHSLNPEVKPLTARRQRRRWIGVAASLSAHLAVLGCLVSMRAQAPKLVAKSAMTVSLISPIAMAPDQAPQMAQPAAAPKPSASRSLVTHAPVRAALDALPPQTVATADAGLSLSAAEIAGAASADSGPSGGACDMARWVQAALRKDPLVQAAVAGAAGKAFMVWNGDWVQGHGEDGKGLAAVREAILWEVAFAPKACRAEPVHGLVLISLNSAPSAPRLAIGTNEWRWSDMVTAR